MEGCLYINRDASTIRKYHIDDKDLGTVGWAYVGIIADSEESLCLGRLSIVFYPLTKIWGNSTVTEMDNCGPAGIAFDAEENIYVA